MAVPLINRTALAKLKRQDLQRLARREKLKANGRNSDIIGLLIAKYPDGVPRARTPYPRKEKLGSTRSTEIKAETQDLNGSASVAHRSKRQKTDANPSSGLFSSLPSTPRRPERFAAEWVESVAVATARQAAAAESDVERELSPPPPPGYKDVRFVRRELVRHVNDSVDIRADVDATEALLKHAVSIYNNVALDFREMACVRRTTELDLISSMKKDRTSWDGMFMMEDEEDKIDWDEFVKEMEKYRAEQKEIARQKREAQLEAEQAEHARINAAAEAARERRAQLPPDGPVIGAKRKLPADGEANV